ncbi:MAG: hydantoinase B/oxoprolinase family protein [Nitrospinota bacterium]
MPPQGPIRIGLDHGRGFVHALAHRLSDNALFLSQAPTDPGGPARSSALAIQRVLEQAGAAPADIRALIHSTSAVTNALSAQERLPLGLLVTAGFRLLLEWHGGKPGGGEEPPFSLVPPGRACEVGGRMNAAGQEAAPLDEESVRAAARQFKEWGVEAAGVCLLHSPANPAHERRVREIFAEAHPACRLSLSGELPAGAREHARARAALLDAACGLLLRRTLGEAAVRAAESPRQDTAILLLRSDGSAIPARKGLAQPLLAGHSGPAGGMSAASALARAARLRRVIALDVGSASTKFSLIEDGMLPLSPDRPAESGGGLPGLEVACLPVGAFTAAWAGPQAGAGLGPRCVPAETGPLCYGKGGKEPALLDALLVLGWAPEALAGGTLPLDRAAAERGLGALGAGSAEEAAWEIVQAAHRAIASRIRRAAAGAGKNFRDYLLVAYGGAGPLLAPGVARELGMGEVVIPPLPAWFGAAGLLDPDRRNEYARPAGLAIGKGGEEELDRRFRELEQEAEEDLETAGVPRDSWLFLRAADLRYRGDSWETRIDFPPAPSFASSIEAALACFHEAFRYQFGSDRRERQPVEITRLRLTALGKLGAGGRPALLGGGGPDAASALGRDASASRGEKIPFIVRGRRTLSPGSRFDGPALIEEAGSTALLPPGASAEVDPGGNLRIQLPRAGEDGGQSARLLQDLVAGTLEHTEREMEGLLRRAARSRYIRKLGLCGAACFDRQGRKLTGRPVTASVLPLIESGAARGLGPGDLLFWNDAHLGGSVGRPAEVGCCAPVWHRGELAGFFLAAAHHEDLGGVSAGSFSSTATQVFQEGIILPPLKLWEGGKWNETALGLLLRNSRRREDLMADLEAQAAAARGGAARLAEAMERLGAEAFLETLGGLLENARRSARETLLAQLPDGAWSMEDHIETDGVDPGRVHTLRLRLTKGNGRLRLDLRGASAQARGPINWPAQRDGGAFLKMWLAPVLQQLGGEDWNEGFAPLVEIVFPEGGSLITPSFPAATNMGALTLQRLRSLLLGALGSATRGRAPADQEGGHWWGLRGRDPKGRFFLFREPLGAGTGARPGGDGQDGLLLPPAGLSLWAEEFEEEFPARVERFALAEDSGGAGRHRGGLGLVKEVRLLCDCEVFALSDRSYLSPWGVNGGRAGGRFSITSSPGTPVAREAPALGGGLALREGDLLRVVTTGGGGWGDPLEREPERVREDVLQGKVSMDQAMRHYGVILNPETLRLDPPGTSAFRQFIRARRGKLPFFDRGPNYASLQGQE